MLDRAIELHLRGDSYHAALHLAGAAEEILAGYIRELSVASRMKPAFDEMKAAIVALANPSSSRERQELEKWAHGRMSGAKNSVKHKRGAKDSAVDFDAYEESDDVIDRAITNYFQLFSALQLPYLSSIAVSDQRRRPMVRVRT